MKKAVVGVGLVLLVLAVGAYYYVRDLCPEGRAEFGQCYLQGFGYVRTTREQCGFASWTPEASPCQYESTGLTASYVIGVLGGIVFVTGLLVGNPPRVPGPLGDGARRQAEDSALKLVRESFAKGEISELEFDRIRKLLERE